LSAQNRNPLTALWDFFCSLKLTVTVLILLAVTSIIGTVVQQNLDPQEYLKFYEESTYHLLVKLQFTDMYHSWWFMGLLVLFSINLIACSIKRLPRVWRTVTQPVLVADDSLYKTLSNIDELLVKDSPANAREKLKSFLGQHFSEPVVTERDDRIYLYAEKGAWARFGVYVTHLSILLIFMGAIVGSLWGYKAFVNIPEGSAISKIWPRTGGEPIQLGFEVRCDDFNVSFYDSGRPREFKSLLTILEDGKPVSEELTRRPIVVNDPLSYKGITFYQSSYGPTGDPELKFRVRHVASGETAELSVAMNKVAQLPGGGAFRVVNFTPTFQNFGPAAQLEVMPGAGHQHRDGEQHQFVVLQAFPEFDARRGGEYVFSLLDFEQRYFTGLQATKDPGVWIVWAGCALMVIGSLVAFFMSHRRIWVTIQAVDNKTGVKIGGSAHRNQPAFELFFDELKKNLKEEFSS